MNKYREDGGRDFVAGDTIRGAVVEIFVATCNSDSSEGRGVKIDKSAHFTKEEAILGASGIGVGGADGEVESRLVLLLEQSNHYASLPKLIKITEGKVISGIRAKLRESAAKKLTRAEQIAWDSPDEIDK